MKNNKLSTGQYQADLSVQNDADVAIGQGFYLTITIKSNETIPSDFNLTLDECVGLDVESINKSTSTNLKPNSIEFVAYLVIHDSSSLKDGDKVSYKINISGVELRKISYTARQINLNEIKLKVDKFICYTPEKDENPENMGDNFICYSMELTNASGHFMKYTPMQIYSGNSIDLSERVIITTNPNNGKPLKIIEPISDGGNNFIPVSSNDDGRVIFRVYPMKDKPAVLQLGIQLSGVDSNYIVPTTYSLSPKPKDPRKLFPKPIIPALNEGKLSGYGDDQKFSVNIPYYNGVTDTDNILFFTENGLNLPVRKIRDSMETDYSFELYYDDFPLNKLSELYYVVVRETDNSIYSNIENFTYIGGGDNIPSDKISRVYEKPIVYSSWANPKSHPPLNNDDDIIDETYYINSFDIKNGRKEHSNNHNNGGYGLFVKIIGTKDTQDKHKPKFGDTINFTMYLNGGFYKNERVHEKDVKHRKDISYVIKDVPDYSGGNTSTTVVYIEYDQLVGFSHDSNNSQAMIYFEYYFYNEGNRMYSDFWSSKIETSGN